MPLTAAEATSRLAAFRAPKRAGVTATDVIRKALGIEGPVLYGSSFLIDVGERTSKLGVFSRRGRLSAMAGALRPALEDGLKIAGDLPYQRGLQRLPFRARNIRDVVNNNCGRLVQASAVLKMQFDQPIEWYAEWCGYIESQTNCTDLDVLLAAAIAAGNRKVLDTLIQSAEGRHPIGVVSQTGIRTLMRSDDSSAWRAVERLLLNAERQEGLRQCIVECADELSPASFKRVLRLIVEHGLIRFSSVFRAFLTWFPDLVDEKKPTSAEKVVMRLLEFLDDPVLEPEATFADTYLRLWSAAYFEANDALRWGRSLLPSPEVDVRRGVAAIVVHILLTTAIPLIQDVLKDQDLRVCAYGIQHVQVLRFRSKDTASNAFHDLVLSAAKRWPAKGGEGLGFDRKKAWDAALGLCRPSDLPIYCENLHELSADGRRNLALALRKSPDLKLRKAMALKFAGDGSSNVRSVAFKALADTKLSPDDAVELESLLARKNGDLRSSVIAALAKQPDKQVALSARRLAASADKNQEQAGKELVELLAKRGMHAEGVSVPVAAGPTEKSDENPKTLFGLLNAKDLTWGRKPEPVGTELFTAGAVRLIGALDEYIHGRRNELTVTARTWKQEEAQIGNMTFDDVVGWGYGREDSLGSNAKEVIPLISEAKEWLEKSGLSPLMESGDMLRARIVAENVTSRSNAILPDSVGAFKAHFRVLPRHLSCIRGLLAMMGQGMQGPPAELLDHFSNEIATTAEDVYRYNDKLGHAEASWRAAPALSFLYKLVEGIVRRAPESFSQEDWKRIYLLYRYIDEPAGRAGRDEVEKMQAEREALRRSQRIILGSREKTLHVARVPFRKPMHLIVLDRCFVAGACTEADVLDHVRVNVREATRPSGTYSAQLRDVAQKFVDKVVDIEVRRGDLPGPASGFASDVSGLIHLPQVVQILKTGVALARSDSYYYGSATTRSKSLTRLLACSRPWPDETAEVCAKAIEDLNAAAERLVELALLSPDWAAAIERAVGWDGLEDAVWWLHAHTKDDRWGVPEEIKNTWAGAISERTPLTAAQLENGACDPAWYRRFRHKLDDKRWKSLDKCAKFASSGTGHSRAQLYAKALSGAVTVEEIVENVRAKRNPNYVRALGLLPLRADADADVRERYAVLQEFLAGSRQFGSARRESEKLAHDIALDNLAATAGYPDALRLMWSLEAAEVQDLKDGGLTVTEGEVSARLAFDALGRPEISVEKAGKALKEIPAALKKLPQIKALTDRRTQLGKQLVRMRLALEQAMQRGDQFRADELQALLDHPGLRPLLRNLVFVGESGSADFPGEGASIGNEAGMLRIAHPYDLLQRGDWPQWQRRVFLEERVQPFKQVFRELYTLRDVERDKDELTRYAGHQVRPSKALAILQKRGWIARHEEGVSKTNHALGITARLTVEFVGFSPADIEGVPLEGLVFTKVKEYGAIPLKDIPPLFFSETVRDLDLVVGVASMVGVDPEASESTVEMRQNVVNQTAQLLHLDNVGFAPRHVVIQGKLAEYTVHLGSGIVHQRAKGELVIVAVRQPQRGRIFLPFVDDDPRTAEIVSKTILLARDEQIKDPTILSQIVG
jgi:hypothetical protein